MFSHVVSVSKTYRDVLERLMKWVNISLESAVFVYANANLKRKVRKLTTSDMMTFV